MRDHPSADPSLSRAGRGHHLQRHPRRAAGHGTRRRDEAGSGEIKKSRNERRN